MPSSEKRWPHAPAHGWDCDGAEAGVCMVTASTLRKAHLFADDERLDLLETELLGLASQYGWQLEAWAVFVNHYHFVARPQPEIPTASLRRWLTHLHANTARQLTRMDNQPGREVWHNYWDTPLTYQNSYLARLNYVHQNPVKHRLVPVANQYPWCSAAWFERTASPSQVSMIYGFKTDKLQVADDDF